MTRPFLIFSGHNDRAVVALCRFFDRTGLPFVIVAGGREDAIHRTAWRDHVIFNRLDKALSVAWLRDLVQSQVRHGEIEALLYCPTTEFINDFLLANEDALHGIGLQIGLPSEAMYAELTSKSRSQALLASILPELRLPAQQSMASPRSPCVLKPIVDVKRGRVLYPLLCRTDIELDQALTGLERQAYFAQDFIIGQSHYLCAYIAKDGQAAWFWQKNLMQQPGGKSIVLARPGDNPGLDEQNLLGHLHERGYHGPFMMEVIESDGALYYIEVNPRFWGPLQLALDVCPAILALFAQDHGCAVQPPWAQVPDLACYAWAFGAHQPGCVVHPAAQALLPMQLEQLLSTYDVYAREDTRALHACH
ncbi:MAG: hypothetical protein QM749_02615 [Aquabacterium sp.]